MLTNAGTRLVCSLSGKTMKNHFRAICTTSRRQMFWEYDKKSGYPEKSDHIQEDQTTWQQISHGWKYLIAEMKMFKEEIKDNLAMDPILICRPGEIDVQWKFDGDPNILNRWNVTADSDYGQGHSTASLQLTKKGRGIFTGNLDPQTFRDGKIKRSGYCNIQSVIYRKSFQRRKCLEWGPYTHLIMRVRGDGRNYLLNLACPGEYDIFWNDSYQYILYTRGGPYWQYVRIPFSKFFFVSKGRIQDMQQPVPRDKITTLGITAGDKIRGNFKLEIDYIGVEYDPVFQEEHAYELYRTPHKFHI